MHSGFWKMGSGLAAARRPGTTGWTFPLPRRGKRAHAAQTHRNVRREERRMEEISVIGIDVAKSVFQLEAQSGCGTVVWTKRLRRAAFMRFMEHEASARCGRVRGVRRRA